MTLNPDKYRHHFDGLDLTDEQKTAMCEAICAVAEAFADRAFGIYPSLAPAANDNDSSSENNVINLFQKSANNQNEEPSAVAAQPSHARRRKQT